MFFFLPEVGEPGPLLLVETSSLAPFFPYLLAKSASKLLEASLVIFPTTTTTSSSNTRLCYNSFRKCQKALSRNGLLSPFLGLQNKLASGADLYCRLPSFLVQ